MSLLIFAHTFFSFVLFVLHSVTAFGQTTHVVQVGAEGSFYTPSTISTQVNDTITFVFAGQLHDVTQCEVQSPCIPLSGGFNSGLAGTGGNASAPPPTWNLRITNVSKPIWFFCAATTPTSHCASGMVGVINPPSIQAYNQFVAAAKQFTGLPAATPSLALSGSGAVATNSPAPSIPLPVSTSSSSDSTTTFSSTDTATPSSSSTTSSSEYAPTPTAIPIPQPVKKSNKAAIIGGSAGGAAGLILVLLLAFFIIRRRRINEPPEDFFQYTVPPISTRPNPDMSSRNPSDNALVPNRRNHTLAFTNNGVAPSAYQNPVLALKTSSSTIRTETGGSPIRPLPRRPSDRDLTQAVVPRHAYAQAQPRSYSPEPDLSQGVSLNRLAREVAVVLLQNAPRSYTLEDVDRGNRSGHRGAGAGSGSGEVGGNGSSRYGEGTKAEREREREGHETPPPPTSAPPKYRRS